MSIPSGSYTIFQKAIKQQPRHSSFLEGRGVPLVKQSPYSPDLNLLDRFMSRHIKLDLRMEEFDGPEELSKAIQRSIRHISENFLVEELKKLRSHLDHYFWDTLVFTIYRVSQKTRPNETPSQFLNFASLVLIF